MANERAPTRHRTAPPPTRAGVDQWIDEAYAKLGTAPEESVRLAALALRAATRMRYATGVARSHLRAGQGRYQLGEYALALEPFEAGLVASRRARDRATEALCINGLGVCYDRLGLYESAIACFERFIELSQSRKDLRAFVMATVNIGHVLERTEQLEEAVRRYRTALEVIADQSVPGLSVLWMNLGVCLSLLGGHREAAPLLERALAALISEERPLDALLCRLNLAGNCSRLGDDERVEALLEAAYAEATRLAAVHLQWRTVMVEGTLHNQRQRYPQAIACLTEALSFSQRCEEPDLLRITHQELSEAHEGLGDAAAALRHYKVAAELKLSAAKALAHTSAQQALQAALHETAALLGGGTHVRNRPRGAPALPRTRPRRQTLSAREHEVLQRLVRGLSNRAIGEELGISTFTARYHVSSIFDKLGVTTRGQAVTRALGAGLIRLEAESPV